MSNHRKRKPLNRSNTQIASLSWQDPTESYNNVCNRRGSMGNLMSSNIAEEGRDCQSTLPRITKIRSIKKSKSRIPQETVLMSSSTTQTSPSNDKNVNELSDLCAQNGTNMQNSPQNISRSKVNATLQTMSESVVHIVSSATSDNVFEEVEEIPIASSTNKTRTPSVKSVRDTGIGIHNVLQTELKPHAKRSMSFPCRQLSLEQETTYHNGSVMVINDSDSKLFEKSKASHISRRSSTQGESAGWTEEDNKTRKRKRSLIPKITRAKSGRIKI